jgi:RNA polymerase sigma factor (sigma-70 family)
MPEIDDRKYIKMLERIRATNWRDWEAQCGLQKLIQCGLKQLTRHIEVPATARNSDSDLFQDCVVRVLQNISKFRGETDKQLVSWMKRVLKSGIQNVIREMYAQKRDVRRERPLPTGDSDKNILSGELESPVEPPDLRAIRDEEMMAIRKWMSFLPKREFEAMEMRLAGASFEAMGWHLGCSAGAARQLWLRAAKRAGLN